MKELTKQLLLEAAEALAQWNHGQGVSCDKDLIHKLREHTNPPKPVWTILSGCIVLGDTVLGWHCPNYRGEGPPICNYELHGEDQCSYCGEPDERK